MALFKISRGMAADLPKTYHEGYCYFTMDDGKFYIDTTDDESGRIVLNAASADTDRLNNIIDETYVTSEELDEIFDGVPGLIDADTLGGKPASDYLLKDEFSVNYNQIIMPDGTIWDGIAATITDTELSNESDNPVANRVITAALDNIVQTNWNENDTGSFAYIKNKPFYDKRVLGATTHSITIEVPEGKTSVTLTDKFWTFTHGRYYAITVNGNTEYASNPASWESYFHESERYGTTYMEYGGISTKSYTIYSQMREETGSTNYYGYSTKITTGASGTFTITVQSYTGSLEQLDDKFISDNIARTSEIETAISNIDKLTSDPRENDEGNPEISAVPVNADTLGGINASEYATKTQVSEIVTEALNNIRLASEVSF